ncbi:ribonuclease, partial [Roseovarius atlanticus]
GNRHGFLAFTEIHPDYYQIPVADREALLEEERAYAEAMKARDEEDEKPKPKRSRRRRSSKAAEADNGDSVAKSDIDGMETIDLDDEAANDGEGLSPMETVAETPVEEPQDDDTDDTTDAATADADEGTEDDHAGHDHDHGDNGRRDSRSDASSKDESIESVADDDDHEDIRPPRKPRPRRYKIQEVIKVRQILLVQVVKEERGNKGAALTTYLSLAGRYCVLMPNTARGGGISRKITNAADRKKLKEIANEIDVPKGAGLIVRTAGAKRTKSEIKRDYEYLQRLWEQIRELTLKSIAPAKIYEEGDLIKRSIRDLYNRDIDEVHVEGERGYRIAKDFMKMIMPSHAKNVKQYGDTLPLFARYQVESYLAGMFNPTVQLKSGGYIVIGVTEALVAIDVNSGRATKEGSIEDTALKTNLEAADEVARQLRLRDLAGLIVIDFIDMDERKNNAAVEKRMKDRLKTDRARIQVGRISGFGLMEMSRQRLRPGMLEATTQPCPACHGTGLIRSDDSMALSILRQIEEEGTRGRSREVLVKCPVGIANFLINQKREHVAQIEGRYGLSVRIEGDPALVSPDFSLEKFKTATRNVKQTSAAVVSVDSSLMDDIDDAEEADAVDPAEAPPAPENQNNDGGDSGDGQPKKKRRRRRRSRSRSKSGNGENGQNGDNRDDNGASGNDQSERQDAPQTDDTPSEAEPVAAKSEDASDEAPKDEKPKRVSRSRKKKTDDAPQDVAANDDAPTEAASEDAPAEKPKPKPRTSRSKKKEEPAPETASEPAAEPAPEAVEAAPEAAPAPEPEAEAKPAKKPRTRTTSTRKKPEPVAAEAADSSETATQEPAEDKPKRKGWWSFGS